MHGVSFDQARTDFGAGFFYWEKRMSRSLTNQLRIAGLVSIVLVVLRA